MIDVKDIVNNLLAAAIGAVSVRIFTWWTRQRQKARNTRELTRQALIERLRSSPVALSAYKGVCNCIFAIVFSIGIAIAMIGLVLPTEYENWPLRSMFIDFAVGMILAVAWSFYDQAKIFRDVLKLAPVLPIILYAESQKKIPHSVKHLVQRPILARPLRNRHDSK